MDAETSVVKAGLTHAEIAGLHVWYASGSAPRARATAERIAKARRWLQATLGQAPPARILLLDGPAWARHATFPVFGMPHFTDERTLAVAATPAPFLAQFIQQVVDRADDRGRAALAAAYGAPPDPLRFFDLLAVHELGHLRQFSEGMSFAQGWLAELHANLLLHGYVASEEPAQLPALTTLVDIGARWPASTMRHQRLEQMHAGVDLDPDNYGWFQMNLHVLAARLWEEHGVDGLRRYEAGLCRGQAVTAEALGGVSAVLADVHAAWPAWRRRA
jgi:hypothetical protein